MDWGFQSKDDQHVRKFGRGKDKNSPHIPKRNFLKTFDFYVERCIFAPPESNRKGNDFVAQLVEQYTFNVWVLGSSPSGITKKPQQ